MPRPSLKAIALFALVAAAAAALIVVQACGGDDDSGSPSATTATTGKSRYAGALISPTFKKPDITLTDTSGKPFNVAKDTEAYVTLLYVGYTNCPDICPLHMLEIAKSLKALPQATQDKIKVVFVTSDPERDTPEVMRKWLDSFDSRFIGLTGTPDQIQALATGLGMPKIEKEPIDDKGNYAVSHAAWVLAYTQDDLAHIAYLSGMGQAEWTHDLPLLVAEGWKPA